MKLGLAQLDIIWENKEENIVKAEKMIQSAAESNLQCLLFPEMSLTGFSMNINGIGENAGKSSTIEIFSRFCTKYDIILGVGYVEKGNPKSYNKYAIINNKGEIIANYAKIHPFSFGEESFYYTGGESIEYCRIENIMTTPFICYDLRFPEIFQIASKHSYLITVASNWPIERREHWITLLKARAIENQCYIAGVNRIGQGNGLCYGGDSVIIDPYGVIVSELVEGEGIATAEIDISLVENYRKNFRLKEDRKLELYKHL